MLPRPGSLSTRISPPSMRAISRLIERPRPVPPYLRLVVPSACWKASKMMRCLSSGMPMPLSVTENATTTSAPSSVAASRLQPLVRDAHGERHAAALGELEGVREQVLEDLVQALRVGLDRLGQARRRARSSKARPRFSATCRKVCSTSRSTSAKTTSPDVDRHRARLDLRQVEDVVDEREQVGARRVDVARELDLLGRERVLRRCRRAASRG